MTALKGCNTVVASKFFPIDGPDGKQLGLFTVPYTVTAVIVRLQYGYGHHGILSDMVGFII